MARLGGMRLRERWSGWNREPFTADSTKHVSVWEKTLRESPVDATRTIRTSTPSVAADVVDCRRCSARSPMARPAGDLPADPGADDEAVADSSGSISVLAREFDLSLSRVSRIT